VLKSGAGAGAETTLDTGLLADGTWRIFGARHLRDGSWAAYSIDASDPDVPPVWTQIGRLNANHPTVGLQPMPLQIVLLSIRQDEASERSCASF
jgi:hypothetical protein